MTTIKFDLLAFPNLLDYIHRFSTLLILDRILYNSGRLDLVITILEPIYDSLELLIIIVYLFNICYYLYLGGTNALLIRVKLQMLSLKGDIFQTWDLINSACIQLIIVALLSFILVSWVLTFDLLSAR